MGNPAHPEQQEELEAGAPWLEDEHVTLLEDETPSRTERESERPKRYDETQRIWCPAGRA